MTTYLSHSGKKGMHWYDRKYQYKDGSLTPLGRIHYGVGPPRGEGQKQGLFGKKRPSGNSANPLTHQDERYIIEKASEKLSGISSEIKKADEEISRIMSKFPEADQHHYEAIAGIADAIYRHGDSTTLDDIGNYMYEGIWGDGNQGYINEYSVWAKETGVADQLKSITNRGTEYFTKYVDESRVMVENLINSYTDFRHEKYARDHSLGLSLEMITSITADTRSLDGYRAVEYPKGEQGLKADSAVQQAKAIVANIRSPEKAAELWYLLDEKDFSHKPFNQLTDAEWKTIYDILNGKQ